MTHPTVLIVDDDASTRRLVGELVKLAGAVPQAAADGKEAVKRLDHVLPQLMVLDIALPGMTGWEVLQDLRRRITSQQLPVIVITAHGQSATADKAILSGAQAFFEKPFNPSELLATIRGLLPPK